MVLAAAARFLEARSRSVDETRRRLLDAGYLGPLVDGAVARLVELGLLDDEAFARAWVASRDRAHPRGERALRTELVRKGIDRGVIDAVLAERAAGIDPSTVSTVRAPAPGEADDAAALRLLERRRRTLERITDARLRRSRAYGLLARHGFDPDTAARAATRFADGAAND